MIPGQSHTSARRLRRAFFYALVAALVLHACDGTPPAQQSHPTETSAGRYSTPQLAGTLAHAGILEASGAAFSNKSDDRLWVVNDGGTPPTLYAFGTDGRFQQSFPLGSAENTDWEDLATFTRDGKNWLLVADTGDNLGIREYVSLYLAEEPDSMSGSEIETYFEIRVQYPDGPRDCEAVAVDVADHRILLLSKRSIPAELYSIPLSAPAAAAPIVAEKLGTVTSIPQPTAHDLQRAIPDQNWHWQPTGMDISADGRKAVILTYRAVYVFARAAGETWFAALRREPVRLDLGGIAEAESVAVSRDGESIFVTTEGTNPPLIRFDYLP